MNIHPIFMSDKRYEKIEELIFKNYKNACIIYINEVENPTLLADYEKYKSNLISIRGEEMVKELQVFHGTHASTVPIICREGFNPLKNVNSAFGRGSYFAKNADYSSSYMKSADENELSYMIIAKIVLGKCVTIHDKDIDFRPDVEGSKATGHSRDNAEGSFAIGCIDNYVDNIQNPSIFVCPHRYAAFPEYIVGFYKNAGRR